MSDFAAETPERSAEETRIPIVNEELEVGKQITEQRHRIQVYPVERQVREQIDLRDETVVIERRPIAGSATVKSVLEARELEIIERHEEPLVAKTAHAVEEVVVRKDVRDRTETVESTIRETKVEVDQVGGNSEEPLPRLSAGC